ncbi:MULTISPECIES: glutathione ABC transporter substrate-binding protein [Fusobacterium]|jgi:peptide/nickel transport system substrate-binding protein|uniref:glutathione ABC transporter substrate-binding protein n=1 Tax=Fusobacterium TaxID=848 RepID=UPI0008A5BFA9|nr:MULTISPECIES: glutathione ABC transporter substrate-binding protein [Fusobacterium]MCI6031466.1 glutathione ABC transporter substrate-binding protein [Fusobacterium varium]MDY4006443.1 glutathione ABC transporter substrate-binding protein [Fusobacterium varium]OFL93324.1 diguanylate phosphodiesterase [Fusobacterium sp. HMSC073F01]RGJ30144.1 glutathione ABC transporter substrate-binding protein [Fusobacterium varium]HBJ79304.1 glutathione ABC transporter substrate-binding protein [Fusobacter
MVKKLFMILLSCTILFSACSSDKAETTTKAVKEKLIIAQDGEPKSLDVHQGNDGFSLRANKLIYSRLVESDGDMNIIPGLAESWEQIDDKTMQFKLRKGVKFHNGYDFTAEDVKFSFDRMANSPRIAFVLPPIEKVEVVDDYTVNIVTKTPFGPLLAHLSHPALGIVSKKLITEDEQSFKEHPIGTGSYKFKEWVPGDSLTLEKNEDYFDKKNGLKYIVFKNIVEASNRTIGLETGEIDISISVSSVDENTIKNNPKLQLITKPSISYSYVGMNTQKTPLNDVRVRKAINYAVDKQAIVDVILNGSGKIATSPIAPGVFGFTDKTKNYEYNVEKARELMKEAGYENGFKTSILVFGGEANTQTAEILQAYLKEIGIDLRIDVVEVSAYWDATEKGRHDLFLGSWGVVTGDADYGLYAMYHSSAKGGAGNRDFYENPKVDELLDKAKMTTNPEERKKLYEEIQLLIVDDAPDIMLYNRILAVGAQKNIKGLNIHPVTLHDFSTVYIEE